MLLGVRDYLIPSCMSKCKEMMKQTRKWKFIFYLYNTTY